jgi:hypothetical protein
MLGQDSKSETVMCDCCLTLDFGQQHGDRAMVDPLSLLTIGTLDRMMLADAIGRCEPLLFYVAV